MKLNVYQMKLNLHQMKLIMHQMKFNLHQIKFNLHQMKFMYQMKLNLLVMKFILYQMKRNLHQMKLNLLGMKFILYQMKLNLHQMKFNFHQIFYRLIGATLIGIFCMIPSYNEIEISVKGDTCVLLGVKGLIQFGNFRFLQPFMDEIRFFVVFRDITLDRLFSSTKS